MSDNTPLSTPPLFLLGEWVERRYDGRVGRVTDIQVFNGEYAYVVDLGRKPMEGLDDDTWSGTEGAWRKHHTIHAHVSRSSRDCDGDYRSGYLDWPNSEERCEPHGDLSFQNRVLASTASVYAREGRLDVTSEGLSWYEQTEEGYVSVDVEWCHDGCPGIPAWQRDLRAEAAGY